MPHLNLPLSAEGAVVEIQIGLSEPDVHRLRIAGRAIPQPVVLRAVIDTGSPITCVDRQGFHSLGLSATGTLAILTASSGGTPEIRDQYDVSLKVCHPTGNFRLDWVFPSITITDAELVPTGIPALIGCDLLAGCLFVYDGPSQIFSLDY